MNTEFEARILEVDKEALIKKLDELGAKKEFDLLQRRYVYDFSPKKEKKWIRLRTNGKFTTLAIKEIVDDSISGTKELEIEVSDFNKTNELLNELGYASRSYQENKRVRYYLNDVEIDIDTWPLIPTYLEVEGKDEKEVYDVLSKLGYDKSMAVTIGVRAIYEKYGIDIYSIETLKFEED